MLHPALQGGELLNTPDRMNEVTEEKGVDESSPGDRHGCGDDKHN